VILSSGDSAGTRLSERLFEELGRTGYRVASNQAEHHELVAHVNATLWETKGLLTVVVNGAVTRSYVADVTVTIRGRQDNRELLTQTMAYGQDDNPDDDDVRRLVGSFGSRVIAAIW
jgi:hypothetical protein